MPPKPEVKEKSSAKSQQFPETTSDNQGLTDKEFSEQSGISLRMVKKLKSNLLKGASFSTRHIEILAEWTVKSDGLWYQK